MGTAHTPDTTPGWLRYTRAQVWFYSTSARDGGRLVNKREYLGSVSVIKLSASHAAVLIEDKVLVHPIEVRGDACVQLGTSRDCPMFSEGGAH